MAGTKMLASASATLIVLVALAAPNARASLQARPRPVASTIRQRAPFSSAVLRRRNAAMQARGQAEEPAGASPLPEAAAAVSKRAAIAGLASAMITGSARADDDDFGDFGALSYDSAASGSKGTASSAPDAAPAKPLFGRRKPADEEDGAPAAPVRKARENSDGVDVPIGVIGGGAAAVAALGGAAVALGGNNGPQIIKKSPVQLKKEELLELLYEKTRPDKGDVLVAVTDLEEVAGLQKTMAAGAQLDGSWKAIYSTENDIGTSAKMTVNKIDFRGKTLDNIFVLGPKSYLTVSSPLEVTGDNTAEFKYKEYVLTTGSGSFNLPLRPFPLRAGGELETTFVDREIRVDRIQPGNDVVIYEKVDSLPEVLTSTSKSTLVEPTQTMKKTLRDVGVGTKQIKPPVATKQFKPAPKTKVVKKQPQPSPSSKPVPPAPKPAAAKKPAPVPKQAPKQAQSDEPKKSGGPFSFFNFGGAGEAKPAAPVKEEPKAAAPVPKPKPKPAAAKAVSKPAAPKPKPQPPAKKESGGGGGGFFASLTSMAMPKPTPAEPKIGEQVEAKAAAPAAPATPPKAERESEPAAAPAAPKPTPVKKAAPPSSPPMGFTPPAKPQPVKFVRAATPKTPSAPEEPAIVRGPKRVDQFNVPPTFKKKEEKKSTANIFDPSTLVSEPPKWQAQKKSATPKPKPAPMEKTPVAMSKRFQAKPPPTKAQPAQTAAAPSAGVVDNRVPAEQWISKWKSSLDEQSADAEKWISNWKNSVDGKSADEAAEAREWIARWKSKTGK